MKEKINLLKDLRKEIKMIEKKTLASELVINVFINHQHDKVGFNNIKQAYRKVFFSF
jgi:hypothetical protein